MRPKCTAGTLYREVAVRPLLLVLALLGAACGAPAEPPRAASPSTAASLPTPAPPAAPSPQVASPPALPAPIGTAPVAPVSPVPPAGAVRATYKGIPTSRTADGSPALGALEAPVTIVDYSDFL